MRKLLLPVDSAEVPENVLTYLKDLVTGLDYEVTLLNVIVIERNIVHREDFGLTLITPEKLHEIADHILFEVEKTLHEAGIPTIHKLVTEGEADRKIVEIAETQDFHLIMMCSHGMGVAKRLLIGSTTNKVIHHSNIPVLVIK